MVHYSMHAWIQKGEVAVIGKSALHMRDLESSPGRCDKAWCNINYKVPDNCAKIDSVVVMNRSVISK